jgi:hypothetical protein
LLKTILDNFSFFFSFIGDFMSIQTIKLKAGSLVTVTREFSSLRITGDKLINCLSNGSSIMPGLYVFKSISADNVNHKVMLEKIGTNKQFFAPVDKALWFESYGVNQYELTTDLLQKAELTQVSNLDKLRYEIGKHSTFRSDYKGLSRDNVLAFRFLYAKKYLESKELTVVRSHLDNLPVFFDGKNFKTFRSWGEASHGISRAKVIPANEMQSYSIDFDGLKAEYFIKYGNYTASAHVMTLKLVKMLSRWHIDNNVSSCMIRDNVTLSRLKSFYRYFRRNGFKMVIIRNQQGNIVARAIIDKNGNYTRVYSLQNAIDRKIESALTEINALKVAGYSGKFIAYVNSDDTLCIPYIDGHSHFDVIDDNHVTTEKGKTFALCEFNHYGELEADSQTFNVATATGPICDCCGERYDSEREGVITANGLQICNSCYQDDYFYCEECGEVHHNDSQTRFIYEDRRGNFSEAWCCESCADDMGSIPFRRG